MTINALYRSFLAELEQVYQLPESAQIVNMIIENIAGVSRKDMIREPSFVLDENVQNKLAGALSQLKKHVPVQYVLAEAWFFKLKFKVSPAVLIPRPETEELVLVTIDHLKNKPLATILDIGTGSGCIAIALKKNLPDAAVSAIDISDEALTIAKENATKLETNVTFRQLDFLEEQNWMSLPAFDIIISNPPYIPVGEKEKLDQHVAGFEPHLALFTPDRQPLIFYEKIVAFAKKNLNAGGRIFMETHEDFAKETAALFDERIYEVEILKDMSGKERIVIAIHRCP